MFAEAAALAAVGTCGISAVLIASPRGHVLIDGGTAKGGTLIARNVEALGFRLRDVRWILSSHEHFDHVGGLAELTRLTGARVAALGSATPALRAGRSGTDDPQAGALPDFAPIAVDRVLRDGESLAIGPLRLTAMATPAHSPGGASWRWQACERRVCRTIVYGDSLTPISAAGYRFADHPERVAAFRAGAARLGASPCDILVTPHPGASRLFERLSGTRPLADDAACRRYAEAALARLDERLAEERQ